MEVQFKLNTEKEDINELKKLQSWLNELITKREGAVNSRIEQQKQELAKQEVAFKPVQQQPAKAPEQQKKEYSGHGRIIDYQEMGDTMSKIFSGERL